jgi:hypothetical protein
MMCFKKLTRFRRCKKFYANSIVPEVLAYTGAIVDSAKECFHIAITSEKGMEDDLKSMGFSEGGGGTLSH